MVEDIKHTPLPWSATDVPWTGIIKPDRPDGSIDTILEVSGFNDGTVEDDIANRDFIVEACNSHYRNKETIRELVDALSYSTSLMRTMVSCGHDEFGVLQEQADENEKLISRARGGQS